jgi:hypothetical protein
MRTEMRLWLGRIMPNVLRHPWIPPTCLVKIRSVEEGVNVCLTIEEYFACSDRVMK